MKPFDEEFSWVNLILTLKFSFTYVKRVFFTKAALSIHTSITIYSQIWSGIFFPVVSRFLIGFDIFYIQRIVNLDNHLVFFCTEWFPFLYSFWSIFQFCCGDILLGLVFNIFAHWWNPFYQYRLIIKCIFFVPKVTSKFNYFFRRDIFYSNFFFFNFTLKDFFRSSLKTLLCLQNLIRISSLQCYLLLFCTLQDFYFSFDKWLSNEV